uniref:DUF6534 domain-containing protein n=1 Tax=Moniliophthora roreri TaxID=221103 RepID=A0A0W0FRA4_MONRR
MPALKLIFGPMLIGVFFNVILWGIMAVQVMVYYQAYKRDALWLRIFVFYLVIAETANSALDMAMMYEVLIQKWGSPEATVYLPNLLAADPVTTVSETYTFVVDDSPTHPQFFSQVLISTPIQIFVAYRIRIISQLTWIPVIICLLALVSLAGGVWTAVTATVVRVFARKPELHTPALTWLLSSAIVDVMITASLYWSLTKRKTGFKSTDDSINRIIRLTVQTGLVTAVFALLDVICFLSVPRTTINFIWDFALSKLYSNALLSTLNARAGWNSLAGTDDHNILFGTNQWPSSSGEDSDSTSRPRFRRNSRGELRGFGWGSTTITNGEMSFAGMTGQSGTYELESAHHHHRHPHSHPRRHSHPLPAEDGFDDDVKNLRKSETDAEIVEYGVAITTSKEAPGQQPNSPEADSKGRLIVHTQPVDREAALTVPMPLARTSTATETTSVSTHQRPSLS